MVRRLLLDTNICIGYLNGKDETIHQKLSSLSSGDATLCSIVKAELLFGARHSVHIETNLQRLQQFFRIYPSVPFDDLAGEQYGIIRASLKRSGQMIGSNDLLIAAIALARDLIVVTRNVTEFSRVPGLRLEVW